jgi:hypothetical protein
MLEVTIGNLTFIHMLCEGGDGGHQIYLSEDVRQIYGSGYNFKCDLTGGDGDPPSVVRVAVI